MKALGTLAVAVLSSLSHSAHGQTGGAFDRLKTCSQSVRIDWSKCVVKVTEKSTEEAAANVDPGPSWVVTETTSPVDYQPQISAEITERTKSQDSPSSLTIRCRARRTDLTFTIGLPRKMAIGELKVVYRINQGPFVDQPWKSTENGRSVTFLGDVVRLLQSLPDDGQILFRVSGAHPAPFERAFQLAGLDSFRPRMAAACNWPRP